MAMGWYQAFETKRESTTNLAKHQKHQDPDLLEQFKVDEFQ